MPKNHFTEKQLNVQVRTPSNRLICFTNNKDMFTLHIHKGKVRENNSQIITIDFNKKIYLLIDTRKQSTIASEENTQKQIKYFLSSLLLQFCRFMVYHRQNLFHQTFSLDDIVLAWSTI